MSGVMSLPRVPYGSLAFKTGRYGSTKFKAFSLLSQATTHYGYSRAPRIALSARQLCFYTGIKYCSLGRALIRWARWDYVSKLRSNGVYLYKIRKKAIVWLYLAHRDLPMAQEFDTELRLWLEIMSSRWGEFSLLKFSEFNTRLNSEIEAFKEQINSN